LTVSGTGGSNECDERSWWRENTALGLTAPISKHISPFKFAALPENEALVKSEDSYKLVISVDMVRAKLSELWFENMVEGCPE
jgi:hypothetical protein